MSQHRYPICPISGKVRFGERKDTKLALRQADRKRSRASMDNVVSSRREIEAYRCSDCRGWHLTSHPTQSIRLVPAVRLSGRTSGSAPEQIWHTLADPGLRAGTAA
jgi:hypothetical protein